MTLTQLTEWLNLRLGPLNNSIGINQPYFLLLWFSFIFRKRTLYFPHKYSLHKSCAWQIVSLETSPLQKYLHFFLTHISKSIVSQIRLGSSINISNYISITESCDKSYSFISLSNDHGVPLETFPVPPMKVTLWRSPSN